MKKFNRLLVPASIVLLSVTPGINLAIGVEKASSVEELVVLAAENEFIEKPSYAKEIFNRYFDFLEALDAGTPLDYDLLYRIVSLFNQYIPKNEQLFFYARVEKITDLHPPVTKEDQRNRTLIMDAKQRHVSQTEKYSKIKDMVENDQRRFEKSSLEFINTLLLQQNRNFGNIEGRMFAENILSGKYIYYPDKANMLRAYSALITPAYDDAERLDELFHSLENISLTDENKWQMKQLVDLSEILLERYAAAEKKDSKMYKIISKFLDNSSKYDKEWLLPDGLEDLVEGRGAKHWR